MPKFSLTNLSLKISKWQCLVNSWSKRWQNLRTCIYNVCCSTLARRPYSALNSDWNIQNSQNIQITEQMLVWKYKCSSRLSFAFVRKYNLTNVDKQRSHLVIAVLFFIHSTRYTMITKQMYRNVVKEYKCDPETYICCPQYTEYNNSCLSKLLDLVIKIC